MSGSSNALLEALANPPTVDVAGAYGTANKLAAGIWANRLAQAQQLSGQAQQDATAPDGTYSPDQYRANLKNAGPGAALAAQSGYAANQALSSDQLNQARDKLGWVAKASGAALTAGDFSDAGMMRVLMQGSADNMLTIPEITKQLQSLPPDAAGRKAWLEQHQNQAMNTQQQLELRYGKPIIGDTGQQLLGGTQAVQGGALNIPQQPGVQLQTGPGTNAALVEVSDAAGNKYSVPRMSLPGASGVTGGVRARADYSGQPNPLLGGLPNPPENGAPAGATLSQVAPATTAAATETAGQNAKLGTALVTRADSVPVNKASYGNMLTDLAKLDTMGPGTTREATINGILQKLTGYGVTMDKSQVAGAESFAKIANLLAAQQLGSLGPTDARQSLAMGANPHLDLSKLGNTQIIHMLQGNEDAIKAKSDAWQKWLADGNSTGTYGKFSSDFNHNFDPRVFQQRYMGAKEIGDLRASMTGPGEAAKFKADTVYARDQGWIK